MNLLNSRSCTLGARHILCTAQGPTSRSVVGGVGRHGSCTLRNGPRPVSGRRVPGVVRVSELQAPSSSPTPVTVKLDNDSDPNYTIISVRGVFNLTAVFVNSARLLVCKPHSQRYLHLMISTHLKHLFPRRLMQTPSQGPYPASR